MKQYKSWFFILILSVLTILTSVAYYASSQIMFFKLREIEIIIRRETRGKRMNLEVLKNMPKNEVKIPSKFGYDIHSTFYHPHETNHWMVLLHGVSENSISSSKYVHMFTDMGYNCVVYDARRHGKTGGIDSTYGYYEKFDLESVIERLKKTYGSDIRFGIHGESMGAATMLLYAGELSNEAEFYISDASFARFSEQLTSVYQSISKTATAPVLFFTYLILKLRSHYSIYELSPIKVIDQIEQPILFIHSKKDKFIPYESTLALYKKKKGPKKAWYPERGDHVESFNRNQKKYRSTVQSFIEQYAGWEVRSNHEQ
ncbi:MULTISPECIES: alpha/beta hydrolase [Jeotgalicoccus]|uniref:alpha/beta hydrolase n=1 Tax=Jeotgalicoccus TaxID=227979 RepID=UPI0003F60B9A|nr:MULTISPECIES: alpha/beta hydrolase [Jeotgalicoccus]